MDTTKHILNLTENLYIGGGQHKKVYRHPQDNSKCLKILYREADDDMYRELRYRRIRKKQNRDSSLLPKYYGTVQTNLGTAYSFELVRDYDGSISQNLTAYLTSLDSNDKQTLTELIQSLIIFRENWHKERVITSDCDPINYLVQKNSEHKIIIRMVDNIGSAVLIPLIYYLDSMADAHVKRHWHRFVKHIHRKAPNIITNEICQHLLNASTVSLELNHE